VSSEHSGSLRRRRSSGGSAVDLRSAVRQRTGKYTIAHDVFFVACYIKLNSFTCVYLIINLDVFIFTDGATRPETPRAPAGEPSGSHSGSRNVEDIEEEAAVGGEVPLEPGTLNAFFFLSAVIGTINFY
jgi:hypothetical protein